MANGSFAIRTKRCLKLWEFLKWIHKLTMFSFEKYWLMTLFSKRQVAQLFLFGRLTFVGQSPLKSISFVCLSVWPSVCLSVCPSVHPSINFLKIGSLFFLTLCLMISSNWRSQIFKKKDWWLEFGPNRYKSGRKWGFPPFYWV